jgi:hypothetical protein
MLTLIDYDFRPVKPRLWIQGADINYMGYPLIGNLKLIAEGSCYNLAACDINFLPIPTPSAYASLVVY